MISFENTEVFNFEGAIRGMRNPLESWDKSDSKYEYFYGECGSINNGVYRFVIGENDLILMKRLIKAGNDHSKFMRQITVSVDITAPLYWWKEYDTYKVGTVANSTSTMHCIHKKEFTMDDFSHEHLIDYRDGTEIYGDNNIYTPYNILKTTIDFLNHYRELYLDTKDKEYWWRIIQLLPSSYNQTRTCTLNYTVIRNMYHSRKTHKLDEWSDGFIKWVENLPYAKELICL